MSDIEDNISQNEAEHDQEDDISLEGDRLDLSVGSIVSRGRGWPREPNRWTRVVNAHSDAPDDIKITVV